MESLFNKTYDMVLPIGAGCPTSIALGSCKMRFVSGPFDWIRVPDVGTVVELLAQRMEGFMDYDDLVKEDENASYLIVRNRRWNWLSVHDFPKDKDLAEGREIALEKYMRRANRLMQRLDEGASVLLLWVDYPADGECQEPEEMLAALQKIKAAYPASDFSLLYMHNDAGLSYKNRNEEHFSPDFASLKFCYSSGNPDRPIDVREEMAAVVLRRVNLSDRFADKRSYRRFMRHCSNVGNQEKIWLERCQFARDFAQLIMRKRFIWIIAKILFRLGK